MEIQMQRSPQQEIACEQQLFQALEQNNLFLISITCNLPQLVIIVSEDGDVLYKNVSASIALESGKHFLSGLLQTARRNRQPLSAGCAVEYAYHNKESKQFFSVNAYPLYWKHTHASAYLLHDISAQKAPKPQKLPPHQDNLTGLKNRLAGMMILNKWLDMRKHFVLCFANLDNIRYVNDTYGREEGDHYLILAAKKLSALSPKAVVSRAGGDEFMILAPDMDTAAVQAALGAASNNLQQAVRDKPFYSNISFGLVEIGPDNTDPASILLELADERMLKAKLENKQKRLLHL